MIDFPYHKKFFESEIQMWLTHSSEDYNVKAPDGFGGYCSHRPKNDILALDIRYLENIHALSMKDEDFSGTTRG